MTNSSPEDKNARAAQATDPIIEAEYRRLAALYRAELNNPNSRQRGILLTTYGQEMQVLQLVERYL